MDQRILLSITEAAARLSIGRSNLYKLIESGEIRSVRIGRSRRIPANELESFVAKLKEEQEAGTE